MKKTLTLLWTATALWAAASCSKSERDIREPETPSAESVESVKVNISVSGLTPDTKAIKKGWESGDIINVYLDDAENIKTPDFTLTYDGSSWNASALDEAVVARLKTSGGTLFGFWEDSNSCISNDDWQKIGFVDWFFLFPNTYGVGREGHVVADFFVPYTFSVRDRTLTATIYNWKFQTDFQVVVSGLEYTPGRYVLYTDDDYAESGYRKIKNLETIVIGEPVWPQNTPTIRVTGVDVGGRIIGIENEDGVAFVGQMYGSASRQNFLFYLHDRHTDITYTFEQIGAINYSLPQNKLTAIKIPFSKFHVDLGLSVKWGACNLGATDPIDGGDYYAWAELDPYYTPGHAGDYTCSSWKTGKTGYNWGSYKYHYSGENEPGWKWMIKYTVEDRQYGGRWWTYNIVKDRWDFIGDGLDTLEPGDDAARQTNGEGWRMPTAAEWQELMDNCTWTWNEDYYNNGIMVTSTVPGYESAKIFLPVVGWREDKKLHEKYGWGAYWSSTINSHDSSQGQSAFFTADKKYIYSFYRSHGLSVRPVRVD